jgi:hypothetical protein
VTLSSTELDALEAACRKVPLTESTYVADDLVQTLLDTVVDYQQHTRTVENAVAHVQRHCWDEVRTLDNLEELFARYPNDKDGNTALAQYLWGYRLWTRAQQLRGLVAFLRRQGTSDLDGLRTWATQSTFKTFEGQIKGLGPAVYQWLVMRLGVETVKPDVHVLRFVQSAIGRKPGEAVAGITEAATRLEVPTRVLDWSIWEHQRA